MAQRLLKILAKGKLLRKYFKQIADIQEAEKGNPKIVSSELKSCELKTYRSKIKYGLI